MKILAWLLLLFVPLSALASGCEVIFVGGALSNAADMHRCFPSFKNVPLGSADSELGGIVSRVASDNSGKCYVFAGHSSGAIKAIQAARQVAQKNPAMAKKSVYLAAFDGDVPDTALIDKLAAAKCVNAITGGQSSRNFSGALRCPASSRVTFQGAQAGGNMYPHFFMVNPKAPVNTSLRNFGTEGYRNCDSSNPIVTTLPQASTQGWNLCGNLCKR